jgi:hypothetical protein
VRSVGDEALLAVEGLVEPVEHGVEGGGQLGHLVVGAVVPDPLVKRLAGQPPRGGRHPVQGAQRPAGDEVRPGHPDDAHRQYRGQALLQQLALGAGEELPLPLAGVEGTAVGQHHVGTGRELVGRAQRLPDQQPRQQDEQGGRADQQDAVEQGEPQPYGRPQLPPRTGVVDGHGSVTR